MKPGLMKMLLLTAITGLFLASCGGGSTNLASNSGGIGGTGVVYGPITNFGSIFVNDLEIDIATAGITTDGVDADETALKLGMVVKVEGTFDANNLTGTATAVTYKDNVEGPITSVTDIDSSTKEVEVLGLTAIISDTTTSFENITFTEFTDLAIGKVIEVSGLIDSAGKIQATHVEKKAESFVDNSGTVIEVKGTIQNVDTTAETFEINSLLINYSSANLSALPGDGIPANGQYVEVQGESFGTSGEFIATDIELEEEGIGSESGHDGDYVELNGFVTEVISLSQFKLDNQIVEIDASTRFEGGTASAIQAGTRLEVEGTIANGILVAQKISIKGSDNESSGDGS